MDTKRIAKYTSWLCVLSLALFWAVAAYAQEDGDLRSGDRDRPVIKQGIWETEDSPTPDFIPVTDQRDALSRALHQARLDNDLERVRLLESSFVRPSPSGEDQAKTILRKSTTQAFPGDPEKADPGLQGGSASGGMQKALFGADRHVRSANLNSREWNQTAACDSNGNLYVAWQDNFYAKDYIQVYWSADGGMTWEAYGYVQDASADLKEPSIAVAEGNEDKLYLAYIVDDGVNTPVPEVASADLGTWSFTFHSIPVWSWEKYAKPVICTDALDIPAWYIYLTCEGVVDSKTSNINVCAWRGTKLGTSWLTGDVVAGNTDADAWRDPDISYGTSMGYVCIACYNDTDNTLRYSASTNYGMTYSAPTILTTLSMDPSHAVDPEIAAAIDNNNIMVCCTRRSADDTNDNIGQMYSKDAGANWTTLYTMNDSTSSSEWAAALTANEGGHSWHVVFTQANGYIYHCERPQDLSALWVRSFMTVNDSGVASMSYPKKGIASNWTTDVCGIAWADYRDGLPDYDTYFDFDGNTPIVYVPSEYGTIQEGIDGAPEGGTVLVARGHYDENIDYHGKMVQVVAEEGAHFTYIDGNELGSVVTFANGETVKSRLEGFTVFNGSGSAGGAVYCDGSEPHLINCVFTDNDATYGGAIFCYNSDPRISNCTVVYNDATTAGGGLYLKNTSDPIIRNSIFWGNDAPSGEQIYVESGSPDVQYSDVEGGWPGTGNIDAYPEFVYPLFFDYHIKHTSPCRDAGNSTIGGVPFFDYEGDPRVVGGDVDMGADEFHLHMYYDALAKPGYSILLQIIGEPGSAQVGFWMAGNILESPFPGGYGDWYLLPPLVGPVNLGAMDASGVKSLTGNIPGLPLPPYDVYLQGIAGPPYQLTNLCTVEVRW